MVISSYMNQSVLEKKFYSFELSHEEEERIKKRKSRVNDGPRKVEMPRHNINGKADEHGANGTTGTRRSKRTKTDKEIGDLGMAIG